MDTFTASPARSAALSVPAPAVPRDLAWVSAIAAATVVLRLPFLTRPTGSDEGGLLLIASQWHPGSSLYGDYWVDRPPMLVEVFTLADRLGGILALRVLGLGFVVCSVLLAGLVGRVVKGSPLVTALVAAALLVNPLLGVHKVNGELVAVPFVLGAFAAALAAAKARPSPRRSLLLVMAGAAAATAALVKQNEIDAFILIAIGSVTFLVNRDLRSRTLLLTGSGALIVTAATLLHAASLGTAPTDLWDAVVTFRLDASRVIQASATSSTTDRLRGVMLALAATGVPLLLVVASRHLYRRPRRGALDLRWAALAVLGWEAVSVLGGGSYWTHYLIGLVPGVVLVTAMTTAARGRSRHQRRPALAVAVAIVALSSVVSLAFALSPAGTERIDPVITWLRAHDTAGQSGLVAFGHPDLLQASGLTSPYPELWSLPVRVRDPRLARLRVVLAGPDRPDWVVTNEAGSLGGWGIDASATQPVFEKHYCLAADLGAHLVYVDRAVRRLAGCRS